MVVVSDGSYDGLYCVYDKVYLRRRRREDAGKRDEAVPEPCFCATPLPEIS